MSASVTVVIPARDAATTIATTLGSILAQTTGAPEIVVVDDASADGTAAAARAVDPGIRVVPGAGRGPGAARNRGVAEVRTPYLAFCDADDTWPDERLRDDLALLDESPDLGIVLGRTRFDPDHPELLHGMRFDRGDRTALIPHFGAATMRTEAFHTVGEISEDLANYEDYEWFLRVRERQVRLLALDRVTLHRRIHEGSTSRRNPPGPSALLSVLQQSVRRRSAGDAPRQLPTLTDLRKGDGQ